MLAKSMPLTGFARLAGRLADRLENRLFSNENINMFFNSTGY
jgi:hypothetical protein